MTLKELANMVYTLPYNLPCEINFVRRTSEADVNQLMKAWLMAGYKKEYPKAQVIFEIALPDGRWFVKATRDGSYYDLYVPDTRTQEQRLITELFGEGVSR